MVGTCPATCDVVRTENLVRSVEKYRSGLLSHWRSFGDAWRPTLFKGLTSGSLLQRKSPRKKWCNVAVEKRFRWWIVRRCQESALEAKIHRRNPECCSLGKDSVQLPIEIWVPPKLCGHTTWLACDSCLVGNDVQWYLLLDFMVSQLIKKYQKSVWMRLQLEQATHSISQWHVGGQVHHWSVFYSVLYYFILFYIILYYFIVFFSIL